MKIFFIISSLKNRSGTERVACTLANKLVENFNYDITIINRDADYSQAAYPLNEKVKIKKISGSYYQFYKEISLYLKTNQPNFTVIHNMGKLSLLCSFLPKIGKLISMEHVSFVSRPSVIRFISKYCYRRFDQVVTLTEKDQIEFKKINDVVLTIANFSPYSIQPKTSDIKNNKIIAIGRLTDQKNFIHLIMAWEKISKDIPNWELLIYGEGEQNFYLSEYVNKNNLNNIYLKGAVIDIDEVYKSSSFFVMSSKFEGLPMVLVEAQTFGLPIISYDCPNGPNEIIKDNFNGFLVENQNIDQLANKILELANSPQLLAVFSKNSIQNALNYQPDNILKIWNNQVFKD